MLMLASHIHRKTSINGVNFDRLTILWLYLRQKEKACKLFSYKLSLVWTIEDSNL